VYASTVPSPGASLRASVYHYSLCAAKHDGRFTAVSAARQPSAIRALQPLLAVPGMISLGGGMPNPQTFPVTGISLSLRSGETLNLDTVTSATALQYSPTPGLPSLLSHLNRLQVRSSNIFSSNFPLLSRQFPLKSNHTVPILWAGV
jgi:DNA-binding transcriptional MocR family regulator